MDRILANIWAWSCSNYSCRYSIVTPIPIEDIISMVIRPLPDHLFNCENALIFSPFRFPPFLTYFTFQGMICMRLRKKTSFNQWPTFNSPLFVHRWQNSQPSCNLNMYNWHYCLLILLVELGMLPLAYNMTWKVIIMFKKRFPSPSLLAMTDEDLFIPVSFRVRTRNRRNK